MSALIVGVASEGEAAASEVEFAADCASDAACAAAAGGLNTVNVRAFDVPPPPPSVRVNTVTGTIAAVATSATEIAALSPVGPAKVVMRGLPFHWTTEHGTRLPPLALLASTPSMNALDPLATLGGKRVVIAGIGSGVVDGATVKGEDREDKAGIVALETVTVLGPGKAVSAAEIAAVSCVELTNAVCRGKPFQFTTSPVGTKFVPFTVRVIPAGLQAGVVLDMLEGAESEVIVGRTIGNEMVLDVFALDAGLATATFTVSTVDMFAAVIAAVS